MDKLILFRALSEYDKKMYDSKKDIKSLLCKSREYNEANKEMCEEETSNKKMRNKDIYYDLCINGNGKYALDTVVGHVQGGKLRAGTSCWISTTSSFDLACSEYAIPQSGNYNHFENRKNVIRLEVEKAKVLSDNIQIEKLRNTPITAPLFIDLRYRRLNIYYNNSILSETFNPDMPGYNLVKDANRDILKISTRINGFSNFATASFEVLAYKEIKRELIKNLYSPLQQDILYGSGDMVDLDVELLEYAYNKLKDEQKEFFKMLYPTIMEGTNLTDILFQNYKNIAGSDIYEKYETLKKQKKELLGELVNIINNFNKSKLNIKKVVDDGILVHSLDNPRTLSTSSINDVILLEREGELYKYSHKERGYVSEKGKVLKKTILSEKEKV